MLREAVDISIHMDHLRDVLKLSGDEKLSKIADEKAVKFRELFELWEGFEKMSDVSKSEAVSDQHALRLDLSRGDSAFFLDLSYILSITPTNSRVSPLVQASRNLA